MATLIATATCAGPVPPEAHFNPFAGKLGAELAEAVFSLAAERRDRLLGVEHRLDDAGIAALGGISVEVLLHRNGVGGHLLRRRIVPLAVDLDDVPLLAALCQRLMDAVVTVAVDGSAGDAAHFEDLAAVRQMLVEPFRPVDAKALLIDVDVDRILRVENVVERDKHDARVVGALDHRLEGRRVLRVDDDRVETGIDEVVDRGDLRGNVLAGGDDLELLELGGDVGLRRIGLGRLDHLDAPGVGDVAVGQRDAEGPLLGRVLEEFRLVGPWRKAAWVGGRAGDHLRTSGVGRRRKSAGGHGHARESGSDKKSNGLH